MIVLDVSVICKIQDQAPAAYGMSGSYSGTHLKLTPHSSTNQKKAFSPPEEARPIRGQGSGQLTDSANEKARWPPAWEEG